MKKTVRKSNLEIAMQVRRETLRDACLCFGLGVASCAVVVGLVFTLFPMH